MNVEVLSDIKLKTIDLRKSHASLGQQTKDNFSAIEKYINNLRLRISSIDNDVSTIDSDTIKRTVRSEMLMIADLSASQVDGTTNTQVNGVNVTRNGNSFIIQTPDGTALLLHNLRVKSSKAYVNGYSMTMDNNNQIILDFSPFISEDLEFLIFG